MLSSDQMIPLSNVKDCEIHPDPNREHKLRVTCINGHIHERPRKWRRKLRDGTMTESTFGYEEDPWPTKIRCADCKEEKK